MDTDLLWALPGRVASQIVEKPSGCWEWTGRTIKGGYGRPSIRGKVTLLHRLTWEMTNGPIPPGAGYHGTCVLHLVCDNPPCCNPAHLGLGSNQDNVDDRVRKGHQVRGARVWTAALTAAQVIHIREEHASGRATQAQLWRRYGISSGQVSRIVNRKSWRHI